MKKYLFFLFLNAVFFTVSAQPIRVATTETQVDIYEGRMAVLSYQVAEKAKNGKYARANYIHPLYALDGTVLTEDFPEDHLHQRGVFWAWHQLYIGDKRIGDGWEIKDVWWRVHESGPVPIKGRAKRMEAKVDWMSPLWTDDAGREKPMVEEITQVTVHPARRKYRLIDVDIQLVALEPNMRIGGSEDAKGYGGFSPRIRLEEEMEFTGPNGRVTPDELPVIAGGWMDISGPIGANGDKAGLTILCHPDNPGYPHPWILRAKESMQNAVYPHPGAKAVPLNTLNLRYRMIVHKGGAEDIKIQKLFEAYKKQ